MERTLPIVTKRKFPLRYWMMVAYAAGIPNFVKFDDTGLTHKTGFFNLTSVASIVLLLTISFLLVVMTLLNRQRLLSRKIDWCAWVWASLFLYLSLSTFLGPPNRLQPTSHIDLLVGLFRLFGWLVAFVLLLSLYSREPEESATDLIIRLIGTSCWFNILLVWVILPISPSLVYGAQLDSPEVNPRLGGLLIHPIGLGVYAGIAFFHALLFLRGWRQWAGCSLALVTLALTYARAQEISFLVLLLLYLFFISRRVAYRWMGVMLIFGAVLLAIAFHGQILSYATRGNGLKNVVTLSERTYVWEASIRAFTLRPVLGYGFVNGAKNALRDQWRFTHWIPPECHNEILQALVSGGIPAGALVAYLYVQTLWKGFRAYNHSNKHMFLLIVLLQLALMSIGEPLLTTTFNRGSALLIMTFVGITGSYRGVLASKKAHRPTETFLQPSQRIAEAQLC